jgi:hypothetical protein
VQNSFNKLFTLLKDVSFSEVAQNRKKAILIKYNAWQKNMDEWSLKKGITVTDMPFGFGIKATALNSNFYVRDWETAIIPKPKAQKMLGWGTGIFMAFDITNFFGIQTEILVNNQKVSLYYDKVANPSLRTDFSMLLLEMPLVIYFKIPSYLFKFYGGASYKHRITVMSMDTEDEVTGVVTSGDYKKTKLRIRNSALFAGLITEIPISQNSTVLFDIRYNRDLYSWFPKWADEKDIFAGYLSFSFGYSLKSASLKSGRK